MTKAPKDGPRLRKLTLAEKLGISRPTLDKYLALEGAPQPDGENAYDVEEMVAFLSKNARDVGGTGTGKSLNEWRAFKLELECQKLQHALEVDRGDYIEKAEAARTIVPIMAELGSLLTQTFEHELPSRCVGKDAIEISQLNAQAIDKIIKRFRTGMKSFTDEPR